MATAVAEGSNRILREATRRSLSFRRLAALTSSCWKCPQGAKRYLLTEDVLRLREFQQQKLTMEYRLYGEKGTYFSAIEEKLTKNRLILRDELKMLLHLCQTKSEVEVAKKVIYRYHEENKNMAFGEYKFGPIFMRLCYELDLEAVAVELIKDQALHGFFSDSMSFNILMDLLFEKGHYECALDVLLEMKRQGVKFNKDTYLLAFAICYKMEHSESALFSKSSFEEITAPATKYSIHPASVLACFVLESQLPVILPNNSSKCCKICTTLLEDAQLKGDPMPRRVYYFAVAFALKQNDVTKAHALFSHIMSTRSRICSNLKVLLQAKFGDTQGIIQTLKQASDSTSVFVKRPEFCMDVLTAAREKLEGNPTLCVHFEEIFAKLHTSGQITSLTLDDLLCQIPPTNRHHTEILKQRQVSQRTLKPLSSTLLSE